jgi:hypothetical protein
MFELKIIGYKDPSYVQVKHNDEIFWIRSVQKSVQNSGDIFIGIVDSKISSREFSYGDLIYFRDSSEK